MQFSGDGFYLTLHKGPDCFVASGPFLLPCRIADIQQAFGNSGLDIVILCSCQGPPAFPSCGPLHEAAFYR